MGIRHDRNAPDYFAAFAVTVQGDDPQPYETDDQTQPENGVEHVENVYNHVIAR